MEKVSAFNFLNEEVEEFMSRWSQSLVNVRGPSKSSSNISQRTFKNYIFSFWFEHGGVLLV